MRASQSSQPIGIYTMIVTLLWNDGDKSTFVKSIGFAWLRFGLRKSEPRRHYRAALDPTSIL